MLPSWILMTSLHHLPSTLTTRLAAILGVRAAYSDQRLVRLDALMSRLTRWNLHYHRDSIRKKIAPIDMAFLFEKGPCHQ